MTRINTIPVELLTDQHAMSEYREIPMVNAALARTLRSKRGLSLERIPQQYTLNSGHVMFHYDKGLYLFNRFMAIVEELNNRHYKVDPNSRIIDWEVFKQQPKLWNDWQPTSEDHNINVQRIVERIRQKVSWYRYQGSPITESFIDGMYSRYINLSEV